MKYLSFLFIFFIFVSNANGFDVAPPLSDREIAETLVELKAGQDKLNSRIDDMRGGFNNRFDDMNKRLDGFNNRFVDMNNRFDDMNNRFDDMNDRFDDMKGLLYIILTAIFLLFGFVLWDRKTALSPAIKKNKELEEKEEKIEKVLKELANEDEKIAVAMRHAGLM